MVSMILVRLKVCIRYVNTYTTYILIHAIYTFCIDNG